MTRRVGGPPPPHAIPVGRAMEQSEERHCDEGRRELAKEEEDGSTWGEGSGGDEEEQHEAATKLQSRQRGRAQRSRYQTKLAAEKLRRRRLPAFVNVYVEGADGKQKVDATPLTRFGGRYDRVDEVDGRRVKGAKVAHYTHRDVAAHLYESMPGLWVLSSVFAPGCAVANAFCHHPKKAPDTKEQKLRTPQAAGAPLGPRRWHFYAPPKKAELSPEGAFVPRARASRGGWLSVTIVITVRDPCGRTKSGQPEARVRRRLTQTQVHPLRPQLVKIYLAHDRNKLHEVDRVLRTHLGREAELLAHLEQKYGPLSQELQNSFSNVAASQRDPHDPTYEAKQQQRALPRRLEPLLSPEHQQPIRRPAALPDTEKDFVDRTEEPSANMHANLKAEQEQQRMQALRLQKMRREAIEQDCAALTAVTSVNSSPKQGVALTVSSGTDGGTAIAGSAAHRHLAAHTENDEGTTAPGVTESSSRLEQQAGTLTQGGGRRGGSEPEADREGRYSRPELDLCASLDLPSASEAAVLALLDAGATCIAMPQPSRAYRVMASSVFETVVPALRVTLGQDVRGRAQDTQQQPDAEPRHGAIVELEGALVSGGVPEYRGLSRADVDTVRGWLQVGESDSGLGGWGASLGFALPSIAAAGYSFSRPPGAESGGMEEAARSLRRLLDGILQSRPRGDGAEDATRRPRIIAKIDGRAGEEPALAALAEAQAGPVDEVIVLTGDAANSWAAAGAGVGPAAEHGSTSRSTVAKIVQEAEAGGLRTLVAVCAGASMPPGAHTWAGSHAGGGSTGVSAQEVVDSDVIGTVERASSAAAAIGSGGVWLTGPGSGSTDVVAAAAQALGEARPA